MGARCVWGAGNKAVSKAEMFSAPWSLCSHERVGLKPGGQGRTPKEAALCMV